MGPMEYKSYIPHMIEKDPVSETLCSFVFFIIPDEGQSLKTQ
jgi:hypothetical protein